MYKRIENLIGRFVVMPEDRAQRMLRSALSKANGQFIVLIFSESRSGLVADIQHAYYFDTKKEVDDLLTSMSTTMQRPDWWEIAVFEEVENGGS